MTDVETMAKGYLEAVAFTEYGDEGQPPSDAEFSQLAVARAHNQCASFLNANRDILPHGHEAQAGRALWYTRNGHGTGFWDSPEVWGEHTDTLNRCAASMGPVDVYEGDDGTVYFS